MRDHLIKQEECKQCCLYCNKNLSGNKWNSEWDGGNHYKITKCSCGKKVRVEVDFIGSGHDDWNEHANWVFDKGGKLKNENKKKDEFAEKVEEEHSKIDST